MQDYRQMTYVDQFPIAMAYVPWQSFHTIYDFREGLSRGTIFPELDKPFCGRRGGCS